MWVFRFVERSRGRSGADWLWRIWKLSTLRHYVTTKWDRFQGGSPRRHFPSIWQHHEGDASPIQQIASTRQQTKDIWSLWKFLYIPLPVFIQRWWLWWGRSRHFYHSDLACQCEHKQGSHCMNVTRGFCVYKLAICSVMPPNLFPHTNEQIQEVILWPVCTLCRICFRLKETNVVKFPLRKLGEFVHIHRVMNHWFPLAK